VDGEDVDGILGKDGGFDCISDVWVGVEM